MRCDLFCFVFLGLGWLGVGVVGFVSFGVFFNNLCWPQHCDRRLRRSASRHFLQVLGVGLWRFGRILIFWGLVVERGEFGWLGGGDLGRLLDLFIFLFLGEGRIGCGMLVSGN